MLKSSCLTLALNLSVLFYAKGQADIYISPRGSDSNNGTIRQPLKTPEAALKILGRLKEKEVKMH